MPRDYNLGSSGQLLVTFFLFAQISLSFSMVKHVSFLHAPKSMSMPSPMQHLLPSFTPDYM